MTGLNQDMDKVPSKKRFERYGSVLRGTNCKLRQAANRKFHHTFIEGLEAYRFSAEQT